MTSLSFDDIFSNTTSTKAFLLRKTLEVGLVEQPEFYKGGTEMKAVSNIFKLQLLRLPQLPLGFPQQDFMLFGQIQEMLNEFGFLCQATFRDFEGKASA